MAYNGNEKKILTITSAAHYMTHLYELTFPAIALSVRDDLGWTLAEVLRLSFLMYLLFGMGALPMGFLADHWKSRWVLVFCMLGAGVGAVLVALSRSQTQFMAALALVGLSISAYHPAGMSLLSRTMRERGRALGINGVFGNLGSATAPLVAGILAFRFGWRTAYGILGLAGVVIALLSLFIRIEERAPGVQAQPPAQGGRRSTMTYFLILCVGMMLAGFSYRGVSLVLPATFREQTDFLSSILQHLQFGSWRGTGNLAATTLASLVYAVGILGQLLGGHLADRHDLRKLYLLYHGASLPFLVGMAFLDETLLLLSAGLYVFFGLGMQPIENSLVARFTPERWRSTSYGVKFILNFGVGSLAVYAVSALQADGDFFSVYVMLAGVVLSVCAATLFLLYSSRGVVVVNKPVYEPLS